MSKRTITLRCLPAVNVAAIMIVCGLSACSPPATPVPRPDTGPPSPHPQLLARVDDLTARATSSIVRGDTSTSLHVAAALTYSGSTPKLLSYGGCPVTVLAYRTRNRRPPAVWNSELRRSWSTGQPYFCFSIEVEPTVAPHSTYAPAAFTTSFPLLEILGDSLPDGRYWFTAELHVNRVIFDVPAGDAVLRR